MYSMWGSRYIQGPLEANRTVRDAISAAVGRRSTRHRIFVTDLVNPRQAYFRRTHPELAPSEEKRQVMMAGTGFHDLFGRAVSSEEFTEQFVEYEGMVGKVDIYEDVPTEVKTTGFVPDDPGADWPGYLDQLGMYCAMVDRTEGRLVICRRSDYGRQPCCMCGGWPSRTCLLCGRT